MLIAVAALKRFTAKTRKHLLRELLLLFSKKIAAKAGKYFFGLFAVAALRGFAAKARKHFLSELPLLFLKKISDFPFLVLEEDKFRNRGRFIKAVSFDDQKGTVSYSSPQKKILFRALCDIPIHKPIHYT